MTSFEIGILVFLIYLCVYSLINRICKCIESCAMSKMVGQNFDGESLINLVKKVTNE